MMRSCAERVALTSDASSVRASTEMRRADRQRGTRHTIGHPDRNRGGVLVVPAQPELATMAHGPLHENGLAVQRMPRIVNRDLLSVVGRM